MKNIAYLAGPIDHVTQEEARAWREKAAAALAQMGVGTYSPAHAFTVDPTRPGLVLAARAFQVVNDVAIGISSLVLVAVPPETVTANGTLKEVRLAQVVDKVLIFFPLDLGENTVSRSGMAAWVNNALDQNVFTTSVQAANLEDALIYIERLLESENFAQLEFAMDNVTEEIGVSEHGVPAGIQGRE